MGKKLVILVLCLMLVVPAAEAHFMEEFWVGLWDFITSIFESEESSEEAQLGTIEDEHEVGEPTEDRPDDAVLDNLDGETNELENELEQPETDDPLDIKICDDECSFTDLKCQEDGFYICEKAGACKRRILVTACGSGLTCDPILPTCVDSDKTKSMKVFGSELVGDKKTGEGFSVPYGSCSDICVVEAEYQSMVIARCETNCYE